MPVDVVRYPRYRFPASIISHAVWLYYRCGISFAVGRHRLRAEHQRQLRSRAFVTWDAMAAAQLTQIDCWRSAAGRPPAFTVTELT